MKHFRKLLAELSWHIMTWPWLIIITIFSLLHFFSMTLRQSVTEWRRRHFGSAKTINETKKRKDNL